MCAQSPYLGCDCDYECTVSPPLVFYEDSLETRGKFSPSAVMSLMLMMRLSSFLGCFFFFTALALTAATPASLFFFLPPIQSCLISLCAKQWIFIFHIRGACIKENLIGPNNVKYPSDMYQPWTCYIRSIMRRVTSVIDFQYPLPNTRPGEFSQLSLEAFANQSAALQALTPLIFAVHQHTALRLQTQTPPPFFWKCRQRNGKTSKHGARKCFTLYGVSYRVAKFQ